MIDEKAFIESNWNLARELEKIYAEQLRKLTVLSEAITNGEYSLTRQLYAVFKELWFEWRPRVRHNKEDGDKRLDEIKELINKQVENKITSYELNILLKKLDKFHKDLIRLMGVIGLGMGNKDEDEDDEEEENEEIIKLKALRRKVENERAKFITVLKTKKLTSVKELKKERDSLMEAEKELFNHEKTISVGVYKDL